jgi:hypothetical protein
MTHDADGELEQILSRESEYIEDDGFTERVLAALPPRRTNGRVRALILISATVLAGLVALLVLPGGQVLLDAFVELMSYRPLVSDVPLAPLALVALLVCGGVAAVLTEH